MSKRFEEENYITIQGFMVTELELKGTELLIYAIIYGITQDGESEFYGSRSYLASACNTSLPTIDKALNSLIEKKLIVKRTEQKNGVIFNYYKTSKETLQGIKKLYRGYKETLQGYKETLYNNKYNNKDINNNKKNNIKKDEQFEIFYNEFPKKVGKTYAKKSFDKIKMTDDLFDLIINNLKKQKKVWEYNKTSKQYIPNPSTWLNQERWNDELIIREKTKEEKAEDVWKKLKEQEALRRH